MDGNRSCISLMRKLNLSDVSQLFQDNSSPPNCTLSNGTYRGRPIEVFDKNGEMRIPLYALIFILSVVGNTLVILTLVQNHRMRTVTNVFLLNLAISDLLLAVFCMPFTLIPQLMRNFIFGEFICVSVRYLQGKLIFYYFQNLFIVNYGWIWNYCMFNYRTECTFLTIFMLLVESVCRFLTKTTVEMSL